MNVDYSAYEGQETVGVVRTVLSRGALVVDDGRYVGTTGAGQFLPRSLNGYLR
jgi:dihydropyrimidinase